VWNTTKFESPQEEFPNSSYDFSKNSTNLKFKQEERGTDRETPQVNGPHPSVTLRTEARLDRRKSHRWRGLGDGQGHHRAPHSPPRRLVPKTLTLPHPRDLALAIGGTVVVCGQPPASLVGNGQKRTPTSISMTRRSFWNKNEKKCSTKEPRP